MYSQFIKEATNQYIDSLDKTLENPVPLIGVYSLVGRIRLLAGDKVLLAAEEIADSIVDSYSLSSTTFDDAYKLAREGRIDPLREFTEAAEKSARLCLRIYSGDDSFERCRDFRSLSLGVTHSPTVRCRGKLYFNRPINEL